MDYWKRMISSDESSFCTCNDSGNQLVWRSKNTRYGEKNTISTENFGGGRIMVWGYRVRVAEN